MSQSLILPSNNLDFAWDRIETEDSLREKLSDESCPSWGRTAAWLMREARTEQVWQFLTLAQIENNFDRLRPQLGRRRPVWEYLIRVAHELGRL